MQALDARRAGFLARAAPNAWVPCPAARSRGNRHLDPPRCGGLVLATRVLGRAGLSIRPERRGLRSAARPFVLSRDFAVTMRFATRA